MKFGIIKFPGSNGGKDISYILKEVIQQDVVSLWHKSNDFEGCDVIILPGGYTLGCISQQTQSPIISKVIEFAKNGGIVFGIGNGFQILCEIGLLPGSLIQNDNHQFISKDVYIKADNCTTSLTSLIKDKVLRIPIAHAYGKYYADKETLMSMRLNHQIIFRYCDKEGSITGEANPNGSVEHIAGVCNENKNIFGMMPLPERASDKELGSDEGLAVLDSLIKTALC